MRNIVAFANGPMLIGIGDDGLVGHHLCSSQTGIYSLFGFNSSTANGSTTYRVNQINPIYYGALLFEQAMQNNSSLLPATPNTSANIAPPPWPCGAAACTRKQLRLEAGLS